jgi:hypothetical protein
MALIEKAKGRREGQSPSGYTRLFGIEALGNLMSRVQGAVIASGNELEDLIWERVAHPIQDLDEFLRTTLHSDEDKVFVATKLQIKKSKTINSRYEPDFIAFRPSSRHCYIVEVKDGDTFDTKKSAGEHTTLQNFNYDISHNLPYATSIHMCCFNSPTREEAFSGLKRKFTMAELFTGRELANLFCFDYDEIVEIRTADQQSNLDYFVRALLAIDNIRNEIVKRLRG